MKLLILNFLFSSIPRLQKVGSRLNTEEIVAKYINKQKKTKETKIPKRKTSKEQSHVPFSIISKRVKYDPP